jgi:hypothetical protein
MASNRKPNDIESALVTLLGSAASYKVRAIEATGMTLEDIIIYERIIPGLHVYCDPGTFDQVGSGPDPLMKVTYNGSIYLLYRAEKDGQVSDTLRDTVHDATVLIVKTVANALLYTTAFVTSPLELGANNYQVINGIATMTVPYSLFVQYDPAES